MVISGAEAVPKPAVQLLKISLVLPPVIPLRRQRSGGSRFEACRGK
jgi:hypothetical protein